MSHRASLGVVALFLTLGSTAWAQPERVWSWEGRLTSGALSDRRDGAITAGVERLRA